MRFLTVGVVLSSLSFGVSLKKCVSYALSHSVAVQKSKNEIEISRVNRKISKVSKFGEINLVADLNHYNRARTLNVLTPSKMQGGKPIVETKNILSLGVVYSVPLFTGGARVQQVAMDRIASNIASIKSRLTREEIAYNVKSVYLTILAQKELLNAQRTYLKALKRLQKSVAIAVKEGKKAEIDKLKAQAEVEATKSTIESLKANIEIMKATLSSIVGKEIRRVQRVKISPHYPRYSTKSLLRRVTSLKKVAVNDLAVAKARRAIRKSQASKLPQLNLKLYAGKNYGKDEAHNLGSKDENIYQVGLHGSWNVVDFGKRDLQIQKAKIAQMQSQLNRVQSIRELKKSIKEAVAKIKESYALYRSSRSEFRLSKKSQKIEKERYQSGVSTINDYLLAIARKELTRAKTIQNRYNYQKSIYYLDYILERGAK